MILLLLCVYSCIVIQRALLIPKDFGLVDVTVILGTWQGCLESVAVPAYSEGILWLVCFSHLAPFVVGSLVVVLC